MAKTYLSLRSPNGEAATVAVDYANNVWISGSKYFGKTNGGALSWFEVTADHTGHFWEWISDDWYYVARLEGLPLHQSNFFTNTGAMACSGTAWIYRAPAVMKSPVRWTPYKDPWAYP